MIDGKRIIEDFKNELGVDITKFNSLDDYVSAILEKMTDNELGLLIQSPGDAFMHLIKKEIDKRGVLV